MSTNNESLKLAKEALNMIYDQFDSSTYQSWAIMKDVLIQNFSDHGHQHTINEIPREEPVREFETAMQYTGRMFVKFLHNPVLKRLSKDAFELEVSSLILTGIFKSVNPEARSLIRYIPLPSSSKLPELVKYSKLVTDACSKLSSFGGPQYYNQNVIAPVDKTSTDSPRQKIHPKTSITSM